jgi:hypothetical protein
MDMGKSRRRWQKELNRLHKKVVELELEALSKEKPERQVSDRVLARKYGVV